MIGFFWLPPPVNHRWRFFFSKRSPPFVFMPLAPLPPGSYTARYEAAHYQDENPQDNFPDYLHSSPSIVFILLVFIPPGSYEVSYEAKTKQPHQPRYHHNAPAHSSPPLFSFHRFSTPKECKNGVFLDECNRSLYFVAFPGP